MKNLTITMVIFFIIFCSCQNINDGSQSDENMIDVGKQTNVDIVELEVNNESVNQDEPFDWSITKRLKNNLINELQIDSTKDDKVIMQFLEDYNAVENDFNDILFGLSCYDSLNTLAYAPNDIIYENASDFKQKAETNGFKIAQSEGMIYLTINTDYIKSGIMELLNSPSKDFINLYCIETDSVCCKDAAILLQENELVNRAFLWGSLLEKSHGMEYEPIAESEYNKYLMLIFIGIDNSPSFKWATGKFNQKLFDSMNDVIVKYPDSNVSKVFKAYSQLLVKSGFKRTDEINAYLNNFMN